MQVVRFGREVGACVEVAVAEELEQIAVEGRAAGAGDDVDDGAGALAELRVVVAGLNAELLHGVRHREGRVDVGELVDVVAAVEQVVGLVGQRAVGGGDDGGGEGLAIALVDPVALIGGVTDTGDEGDQVERRCVR